MVILSVLGLNSAVAAQIRCGEPYTLGSIAQTAYAQLHRETTFAFGGTGYGGNISDGEKAIDVLMEDVAAPNALYELATTNAGVGGLYGLAGLRILNCDCLRDATDRFLKLPDQPEKKNVPFFGTIAAGDVMTLHGCVGSFEKRTAIVEQLEKGEFDSWFEFSKRLKKQRAEKAKTKKEKQ